MIKVTVHEKRRVIEEQPTPASKPIMQSRQCDAQTTPAHLHWCGAHPPSSVKNTTSQNVRPELIRINLLIKTVQSAVFVLRRQPRNLKNVTLIARRRVHFRVLLQYFWLLNSLQKEVF